MALRDYQQECHDAVLAALGEAPWHTEGETFRSVLVNMATSAGKTVTIGAIIASVMDRGRCLFMADTDELCAQPLATLYRIFNIHASLEKAGSRASREADVVVGSAQTLAREARIRRFQPDHFSYIFVDEAHRGSDRNKKITDYFPEAKVVGMTATAFRAKLADLSKYYEHVAFELGVFDLIDEGYIAPLKVLTLPVNVDISEVHQKTSTDGGQDFDKVELDTTIRPYYEEICRMVKEHAGGRTIIAYLPLIKSSQEFVEVARAAKINARHIDGKSLDRESILDQFAQGDIQLLSNSSLLTTGWDCPRCDCLLNLAPTRSAGLFRQKVGRIGRILPGIIDGIDDREARKTAIAKSAKPDALILDLLWQTAKFDLQGPSDLIAANPDEREAIQRRLRETGGDLQEVTAEVQAERENALKQALIDAAKRSRRGFTHAIELVAAMLRGRKVLNYQPVSKWETLEPTEAQVEWFEKNGYDPKEIKDRGHASAFMNLIIMRRKSGLASPEAVELLESEEYNYQGAAFCTAKKAFDVLGGNYPMSFGKHKRRPLKAIPVGYWEYMLKQSWFKNSWPIEYWWAMGTVEPAKGGCTCIGSHIAPNCPVHERPVTADTISKASSDAEDDEIPF